MDIANANMDIPSRCRRIQMILSDVDGVMTDGRLIYNNDGIETKRFHVRDGQGISLWRKAGYPFGLITLRDSHIVQKRARELNLEIVHQGAKDKAASMREILQEQKVEPDQVCYIGDDLPDVGAVRLAGLGVAVADACPELRNAANYVTQLPGGSGAVREIVELILKAQDRWDELIAPFLD